MLALVFCKSVRQNQEFLFFSFKPDWYNNSRIIVNIWAMLTLLYNHTVHQKLWFSLSIAIFFVLLFEIIFFLTVFLVFQNHGLSVICGYLNFNAVWKVMVVIHPYLNIAKRLKYLWVLISFKNSNNSIDKALGNHRFGIYRSAMPEVGHISLGLSKLKNSYTLFSV